MKPDWKDAPEWALYRATDSDGTTYWHETSPVWNEDVGEWLSDGDVQTSHKDCESLESRP